MNKKRKFILWFKDISMRGLLLVGGKMPPLWKYFEIKV